MFVLLSKILPLLVYPVGLITLTLMLALCLNKHETLRKTVLWIGLGILFLCGNKWVAYSAARSLEWQILPLKEIPSADAIVVLGGATMAAEYPRSGVELNGAADRVFYTADLYAQGKAPTIISSGGSIEWQQEGQSTPAEEMASLLVQYGKVPKEAIVLQNQSYNTHEDAVYSAQLLKEMGIQKIILVTSAMHMPRSTALFKKQGLDVIPAPTDYRITQSIWNELWKLEFPNTFLNLIPTESNLSLFTNVMKEYIGIMVYRMQGWL